ncbi:MAG TPA: GFA family protein [Stellaceae bacterium]|nr:GFA family protein [Stellaceae bacterium]
MKVEGGCLCGKVRYSGEAEPIFMGVCHCTNCQKSTGTAFNAVVAVPKPAVSLSGAVSTYEGRGDTGNATYKYFCPECGSPVGEEAAIMADVLMIPVGTLDDPGAVTPAMQIYCDSAQPWALLGEGVQRFPKMPMPG